MSSDNQWHLNKSVPVTLIFTIILQTIGMVWFAANLRSDVNNNTSTIQKNEVRVDAIALSVQRQDVTLARIDENLKAIREAIERLGNESQR